VARGLREQQDRSQEAVAARMREIGHDWHQTTVSKVENGQRVLSLPEAYDLAIVLDRHLRDFLVGESSKGERDKDALRIIFARLDQARLSARDAAERIHSLEAEAERIMADGAKRERKRKA
jgi:transcriptional regulator with XRE-family HTH domain